MCITVNPCPGADMQSAVLHLSKTKITYLYMSSTDGTIQNFPDATHQLKVKKKSVHPQHIVAATGDGCTAL